MRVVLTSQNQEKLARRARSVMRGGGMVVYPTDTVYGLGADATNERAVNEVYLAKGRPSSKAISVAVASLNDVGLLAELDNRISNVLSKTLPGPYTVILRSSSRLPHLSFDGKIGIRIPNHPFALMLCRDFPITCTSANLSGMPSPRAISEVAIKANLAIDAGPCPLGKESTVIDFTSDRPKILREGAGDVCLLRRLILESGLPDLAG